MDLYIMYLRKSQMDRDFEELSVEETLKRHRKMLEEFAVRRKLYIAIVLEEVVSGESLSSRPKMLELLELVNTGDYAGVVCMDIDRLSRGSSVDSGYIMQVLQINGCKILTPDKTYDLRNESDEQFADMKFMFSRYELRTITKRLVKGRNTSASEGKYLGSEPPYGYNILKLQHDKGNTLEINTEEARVVQMIFDLYTEQRLGFNAIVYNLNMMHIKARKGKKWSQSSIVNILTNVVYIGKIRWKYCVQEKRMENGSLVKKRFSNKDYEIHEGLHAPIISEEQFERVQEIRTKKYNPSVNRSREITNPFAEIMFCEVCGAVIKRNTHGNRKVKPRVKCREEGKVCKCKSHVFHEVEEAVVSEMRKWLQGYKLQLEATEPNQDDSLETALDMLQSELDELLKQQNNICILLEKEVYSIELFSKRNAELKKEIDQVKAGIEDLEGKIFNKQKEQVVQNNIIPVTEYLLDSYERLSPREKNDIWKEVLEKITYYKDKKGGDFRITIYPKLPRNPS